MKFACPLELVENKLLLGFEFPFHKDRLLEQKNKNIVENVISNLVSNEILVDARLLTESEKSAIKVKGAGNSNKNNQALTEETELVGSLLEEFGGKVVG